jgi:hypothetical protein
VVRCESVCDGQSARTALQGYKAGVQTRRKPLSQRFLLEELVLRKRSGRIGLSGKGLAKRNRAQRVHGVLYRWFAIGLQSSRLPLQQLVDDPRIRRAFRPKSEEDARMVRAPSSAYPRATSAIQLHRWCRGTPAAPPLDPHRCVPDRSWHLHRSYRDHRSRCPARHDLRLPLPGSSSSHDNPDRASSDQRVPQLRMRAR